MCSAKRFVRLSPVKKCEKYCESIKTEMKQFFAIVSKEIIDTRVFVSTSSFRSLICPQISGRVSRTGGETSSYQEDDNVRDVTWFVAKSFRGPPRVYTWDRQSCWLSWLYPRAVCSPWSTRNNYISFDGRDFGWPVLHILSALFAVHRPWPTH